jgi:mediator of RNA polymerase II transcription subunit 12
MPQIQASPASNALSKVQTMLEYIVRVSLPSPNFPSYTADHTQALYTANEESLLSPAVWRNHSTKIKSITRFTQPDERLSSALDDARLAAIERRSHAMIFQPATSESSSSPRRQQMEDLRKLDMLDANTDTLALCKSFFDGLASPISTSLDESRLEEKVFALLNWAMGLFHLGVHRAYAVQTLLKHWQDLHETVTEGKSFDLFPILYRWLDTSDGAKRPSNALAIGVTFGELIRQGTFSYGRYLQAIISHGHSARSRIPGTSPSHHSALLRAMPIFVQAKDLLQQRRIALCGDDMDLRIQDEVEENRQLEAYKEDVREYIPEVFGWSDYTFVRAGQATDIVQGNMAEAQTIEKR